MTKKIKNCFEYDILIEDLKISLEDFIGLIAQLNEFCQDNINSKRSIIEFSLNDKKEKATLITIEIKMPYVGGVQGVVLELIFEKAKKYIDFRPFPDL